MRGENFSRFHSRLSLAGQTPVQTLTPSLRGRISSPVDSGAHFPSFAANPAFSHGRTSLTRVMGGTSPFLSHKPYCRKILSRRVECVKQVNAASPVSVQRGYGASAHILFLSKLSAFPVSRLSRLDIPPSHNCGCVHRPYGAASKLLRPPCKSLTSRECWQNIHLYKPLLGECFPALQVFPPSGVLLRSPESPLSYSGYNVPRLALCVNKICAIC